jgi:Protein of unknown function (DUF1569)
MKNIFDRRVVDELIARVDKLGTRSEPQWGTMNAAQMLAHCCKPYETVFDPAYAKAHPKPNAFVRFLLRTFLKQIVVGEKPYRRNSRTAPEFIVADSRDIETERARLVAYLNQVQSLGATHFNGKESHSFGAMTSTEWNNLFYKHLDHHLVQFGV